jgi:hypothetical protein
VSKVLAPVCLAAVVALAGCNDDNANPAAPATPTPAPNPSPSACADTTLATATKPLSRNVLDSTAFTTTAAGHVDITVDWTNAQSNLGAFVVESGSCSQQRFNKGDCTFLIQSGEDKPHKLGIDLPAGSYELLLNYFGSGTRRSSSETATVQVVQTCPAP